MVIFETTQADSIYMEIDYILESLQFTFANVRNDESSHENIQVFCQKTIQVCSYVLLLD